MACFIFKIFQTKLFKQNRIIRFRFETVSQGDELKCSWKKEKVKVVQSCPTLCDPRDYTVHGILQARILERVAFPFSRGYSQTRDQTQVSLIAGRFFTSWATREAQEYWNGEPVPSPVDLPNPRILEWGASPFSRGSSRPRNRTDNSCIASQADCLPTELSGKPWTNTWAVII